MTTPLSPSTPADLVDAVRSLPCVLAVGARTKPRLSERLSPLPLVAGAAPAEVTLVSTRALQGIIEYEPEEFTFTARAGTPVREITSALAERGQYLPFDPLWLEAGATIGGTVAAGVSGPGRFRFGGVRDFILGIRFVDGQGHLLHMGGKVVKNAAGFDLPKFFVGSLGRFGVLAEVTFKVFPTPAARLTLKLKADTMEAAVQILRQAASARWEPEALDLPSDGKSVCLRLMGPAAALTAVGREILSRWPGETLADDEAGALWSEVRELRWAHADGVLLKLATTPGGLVALDAVVRACAEARMHVSVGGNVVFVSLPAGTSNAPLDERLKALGLSGVTLRGDAPLWWGTRPHRAIDAAVKEALDPQHRFPDLT
jgi:glycolate oxidase FAD binding subunit